MTTHISARVAWHMDGWNGHICKDPAANAYCVGCHSYPGEMIREKRDLAWEQQNAGADCADLSQMPPCMYSVNAFGARALPVSSDPPDWFGQGAQRRTWQIPPATVCVWPYEQMYLDDVRKQDGTLDHALRLDYAKRYFAALEPSRSLIFYYANYSNPFTEEDEPRYVLVGVSRIKQVSPQEFYENCSEDVKQRYAGGFVWQRSVTSHYPDQGFRLPFHAYQDRPEVLETLALFPDNPRNFKYGTRAFTDDEALNLVERFLEVCGKLHALGDTSENWPVRIAWLQSLVAELWQGRGLYPGMATVLDALKFPEAIKFWKDQCLAGAEDAAKTALFGFLDQTAAQVPGLPLPDVRVKEIRRAWQLHDGSERALLSECLPRFAFTSDQLGAILSDDRMQHGLVAGLDEIAENPYLLCEQFVGDGPDDILPFYRVDHGMFPSPELGAPFLVGIDDWRRLRGLCVEQLRRETRHAFLPAADVIHAVNERLAYLPEWKRHQFNEPYLAVDRDHLAGALTFREKDGKTYLYLKSVYEAERVIETQMRTLVSRPDIKLASPVTAQHWHTYLFDAGSPLAERSPDDYEAAIQGQVQVCQGVYVPVGSKAERDDIKSQIAASLRHAEPQG